MKPTIQTVAGLYKAACDMRTRADMAMETVLKSPKLHGYTEDELLDELGWTMDILQPPASDIL